MDMTCHNTLIMHYQWSVIHATRSWERPRQPRKWSQSISKIYRTISTTARFFLIIAAQSTLTLAPTVIIVLLGGNSKDEETGALAGIPI